MQKKLLGADVRALPAFQEETGLDAYRLPVILQMINQCYQTLVRADNEQEAGREICRIMVETGGYSMAWAGFTAPEEKQRARRTAKIGFEAVYPVAAYATWHGGQNSSNPARTALRTRRPTVVRDSYQLYSASPWKNRLEEPASASVMALPLMINEQTLGALHIYATGPQAFGVEETRLLVTFSQDLAYGIGQLRERREQAQLNQQLAAREQFLRALMRNSSDVVMVLDADGNRMYVSLSVQRILGYTPEELTGKSVFDYIHPGDLATLQTAFGLINRRINATGRITVRFRHANGSWLYLDCTGSNQMTEPNIHGIIVNLRDITELKQAENRLRRQQQEQQMIFDSVPAMISYKDRHNRIIRLNKPAADFYGLPPQEVEGKFLHEFISQTDANRSQQNDLMVIDTGQPQFGIIEQVQVNSQPSKWLQTDKIPYFDEEGTITGIVIFSQEITEQKQAEDNLRETLEELRQRNYELDNYFYKVSHDIRSPLCSILGLTNLIKMEQNTESTVQYLQLIEKSITKLDTFVQTLLNHSRVLNASSQVTSVNFRQIIDEALREFAHLPQANRLRTSVQIHSEGAFYNDQTRLAIIFRHLISNAIRFQNLQMDEGQLTIDVNIAASKSFILIKDNGLGIEKQYLSRIFNMFFKATDRSEGAGLGLYVAKQTITKLGGSISVRSEVGKGTSFQIILGSVQG